MRVKARWHIVQRKCLSTGFMVVHRGGGEIRGNESEDRVWEGRAPAVLVIPPMDGADVPLLIIIGGLYN